MVDEQQLKELFTFYTAHPAAGLLKNEEQLIKAQKTCVSLFSLDYEIELIQNTGNNQYCASYPANIILLKREKSSQNTKPVNTADELSPLFMSSRFSRVHGRFPVPVILLRNKNICRSATISVHVESIFNNVHAKTTEFLNYLYFGPQSDDSPQAPMSFDLDSQRLSDVKLLQSLGIRYVCDLMVEHRKTLYGVTLTSSEKVDPNYQENRLEINAMPYPGCEFFKEYKENEHKGIDLQFNWNQSFVDADVKVCSTVNNIANWTQYKEWDIILLTSNYLKTVLKLVQDPEDVSGVLVHCISGWDRTPLFISLIRLSLWADGLIHQKLSAMQILYLTLAYDWMLFTHQVGVRLTKGEDIIHFSFNFLQTLADKSFSVHFENSMLTSPPLSTSACIPTLSPSSGNLMHDDFVPDLDLSSSHIRQTRHDPRTAPTRASMPLQEKTSSPINIPQKRHHKRDGSLKLSTPSSLASTSTSGGHSDSWQLVANLQSQPSSKSSMKSTSTLATLSDDSHSPIPTPSSLVALGSEPDFDLDSTLAKLEDESLSETPIPIPVRHIDNYFPDSHPSDLRRLSLDEMYFSDMDLEETSEAKTQKDIMSTISNGSYSEEKSPASLDHDSDTLNHRRTFSDDGGSSPVCMGLPKLLKQTTAMLPGSQDLMFTLEDDDGSSGGAEAVFIEKNGEAVDLFGRRKEKLLLVRMKFIKLWEERFGKDTEKHAQTSTPVVLDRSSCREENPGMFGSWKFGIPGYSR